MNAGDVLKGGDSTNDTLFIGSGAGAENFAQATITKVEKVVLNGGAIDVSQNNNVESVSVNAIAGAGELKVRTDQTVVLNSVTGTAEVITYTDAAGTADEATVALNNVTLTTGLTNTGIEKAIFLATGKNVLGTLQNGSSTSTLADVTFEGAGSVVATLTEVNSTGVIKSIDASKLDGGLTLTIKENDDLDAKSVLTGGKGKDTLIFSEAVAAGSGSAADYLKFEHVKGFDTLATTGADHNLTVDRSLAYMDQFTTFAVGAESEMLISGVVNGNTFNFSGSGTGNSTIDMVSLDHTKINVNLLGNANLVTSGQLMTDATDILLTSTHDTGTENKIRVDSLTTGSANSRTVVTLAGDTDLTLTFGTIDEATANGVSVKGADFTGKLTVTATGAEDILIGGNGVNSLTGGTGNDTITGGKGVNTLLGEAGDDTIIGGAGTNTITGGGGIDKIDISLGGDDSINLKTIDAAANRDVVTGFTAGKVVAGNGADIVKLDGSGATATTHTIQEIKIAPTTDIAFDTTQASGKSILELAFDLAGNDVTGKDLDVGTTGTALIAALGQDIGAAGANEKGYILAYQGGNAYLYHGAATSSNLGADQITLIGVFNAIEVGAFDASNFNFS